MLLIGRCHSIVVKYLAVYIADLAVSEVNFLALGAAWILLDRFAPWAQDPVRALLRHLVTFI